ncbi:hypothetical protein, partial [Klebsiella pneumoniae]|uniref:hypothetical protein n=1 Tax=Klebsiella pneumoniae TaxID=573 RepID=UPI0040559B86
VEFVNRMIREMLTELHVERHYTTTGHTKSRGTVERLHGTLTEHLRLLREKGITGTSAMAKAVLAYNNSIHTVTRLTPFEALFQQPQERQEPVEDKNWGQVACGE